MLNRRQLIKGLAVFAAASRESHAESGAAQPRFGELRPDPDGILDLPEGFSYTIVAEAGQHMDDGLLVPGRADGMAAFDGGNGSIILVCNHENWPTSAHHSPFGPSRERLDAVDPEYVYDLGGRLTPGLGGTTTIHYDPVAKRRTRMFMSLIGTEVNCAGGATPWGSWLSCEECVTEPGETIEREIVVWRERRHGYVFEVPAKGLGPVRPEPLVAMGRFEHEAAAVNPSSGFVYMTEDRHDSLLYRFIPNVPGRLAEGGRLQALAVRGKPKFDTRNWQEPQTLEPGRWYDTEWIDLDEPDTPRDDLRHRGLELGAAVFARGEGLVWDDGEFVMAATIGGPDLFGQLFTYRPSPVEGTRAEADQPGRLRLFVQSNVESLLRHADNLTASPWGDVIACEDTVDHCGLVGLTADGQQYALADNAYTDSELAGICFSPDGSVMFVNVQDRGLTLAITGPWATG